MFTSLNDPGVEAGLSQQFNLVVREVTKVYGNECTLILAGGFGRGEGSMRLTGNGWPLPLHDFDLYVVTDKKVASETHAIMERRILTGLSQMTGSDLEGEHFVLGIQAIPLGSLARLPPDLSTYELKSASKVLHGSDVRPRIPVGKGDVALASGAITLFHRTTALLKNMEPEYLEVHEYPLRRSLETVYECCKVYTEICTALSLIGRFYEPSYRLRAENFRANYDLFPSLKKQIPELAEKISFYTELKLRSDFSPILQRPVETWIEARRVLNLSLRYFLSRFLGTDSNAAWPELCQRAEGKLRWFFFHDYLSFYLSRLGLRGSPLVHAASLAFQAFDSASFSQKVKRAGRAPARRPFSLTAPILNVYLGSALTLYSLDDRGTVEDDILSAGWRYIGKFFQTPAAGSSDPRSWKKARDECVEGQRLYFGINRQKRAL